MSQVNQVNHMDSKASGQQFANIKVVGVGGGGNSTINWMIQSKVKGVEFIAINTDAQALQHSIASHKLNIGKTTTRGLGAGMDPEQGRRAAEENQNEIRDALKGADMVFVTCGLGGGTGTGASPLVAEIARDVGALTIAVVTKPFSFEGAQRANIAEKGHQELSEKVDTIITIPNDRVLQIIDAKTTLLEAFGVVNEVLRQGVQGIAELITVPGLINVDFADVKAVMRDAGSALMGIGEAKGEGRAQQAAKSAITSPLLELSIEGARGMLFIITGGRDLTMNEVNEAAHVITESADKNAKIIFGTVIDDEYKDRLRITVVATGFGATGRASSSSAAGAPLSSLFRSDPRRVSSIEPPERPLRIPVGVAKAAATSSGPSRAETHNTQESDLEIPAFLRKKIGK